MVLCILKIVLGLCKVCRLWGFWPCLRRRYSTFANTLSAAAVSCSLS